MAIVQIYSGSPKSIDYVKNKSKTKKPEASIKDVFNYISQEQKIYEDSEYFISSINCSPDLAAEEFIAIQKAYGKYGKGIPMHHGWQSFSPEENLTPAEAHKIGVEFAETLWGDRFQVIVTTHLDKAHLHNHFVINSVSFVDGKKYYGTKASIKEARALNDKICKSYGLSVIKDKRYYGRDKRSYRAEARSQILGRPARRDIIKDDIDIAIFRCKDIQDFYTNLSDMGYLLKFGKHFAVSPEDFSKNGRRAYIRLKSLNDYNYTIEGIRDRIDNQNIYYMKPYKAIHCTVKYKKKLNPLAARYYRYMYRLGLLNKKPYNARIRKGQIEASTINEQIKYIYKHRLKTDADVADRRIVISNEIDEIIKKRKPLYDRGDREGIVNFNEKIKKLREEKNILEKITVKQEELKKEGKLYECRSRSSGNVNKNYWSWNKRSNKDKLADNTRSR